MIESATRYVVRCDGDDYCSSDTDDALYHEESDAAEGAVNLGWRTDGELFWCPDCQVLPHGCAPDPEDRQACARCGGPVGGET